MNDHARLLYMGHASIRIVTADEKAIYIDPYVGDYSLPADLILVTHGHGDHNAVDKVEKRNKDCRLITWKEALADGRHQCFDLGYVKVEAVEAGNNPNHHLDDCVGYLLSFPDDISVYISGDTSKTEQMASLSEKDIDYAFYCCDGKFNMDMKEAEECSFLVKAKHSIPYHMVFGKFFDEEIAKSFKGYNPMVVEEGEEIVLR